MTTVPPDDSARPLIAFVDDERAIRRAATKLLEPAGYRLASEETSDDAIALRFGDPEPDALLTDLWGPCDHTSKGAALVAIRRCESAEFRRQLPIAILSGDPPGAGGFVEKYRAEHPDGCEEGLREAFLAEVAARRDEWAKSDPKLDEKAPADRERSAVTDFEVALAADAYLRKPVDVPRFLQVAERLLALGTATRA